MHILREWCEVKEQRDNCFSWSDLPLKTLIICYVLRIRMVHFVSFQAQLKFNTRCLSFMAVYTTSGINQTGFRLRVCGERGRGVMTREKTLLGSAGCVELWVIG